MKHIFKLSLFIFISILILFTFSCKDPDATSQEPDSDKTVNAIVPTIELQPQNITVKSGNSYSLSVKASVSDGGTISYQWYKSDNDKSEGTKISSATSDKFSGEYTLKESENEVSLYYYVVVTNTNDKVNGKKTATITSVYAKVTIKKDILSDDTTNEDNVNKEENTNDKNQGDSNADIGDENQGDSNVGTDDENQGDSNAGTDDENQGDSNAGTDDGNQGDSNAGTDDGNQGGSTDGGSDVPSNPDYVPSEKSGVMLQGFNWSSAKRGAGYDKQNPSPYWYKWYKVIENQSEAISEKFAYLWCPPPSATDTSSSEGYGPTELNNLNNCYGTEDDLTAMIQAIKPTKAIADIVVNHRTGATWWADFQNPDWGVVDGSNYKVICSDDEGFSSAASRMQSVPSSMKGNADTGAKYEAYRDLDHTNTTVQKGIVDWMNNVLKPAGFVGWRYDYVKGFAGKYVGQYNEGSNAEFSVGEYWPTAGYNSGSPDSWGNEIKNWINATDNGGQRSKAFDFALKGAMNTVFGNNASNVSNNNYGLLADSANLVISQPSDAVTFVDNHDTGSTQKHWYLDPVDVGTAYAFILTHPGVPCVAWQHYFTFAESGSIVDSYQYTGGNTVPGTDNTYRKHIDYLIDLRNRIGIEYDDTVKTTGTSSSCYVGEVPGNNGTLLVKIGNVTAATGTGYTGNDPIYSGTNFAIWEKNVDGDAILGGNGSSGSSGTVETGDVTLTVTGPSWTWESGTSIFCWAWKDGVEGSWYSCTGTGTTIYATVPSDAQYFQIVRCYYGTVLPDWKATGDILGRIYNKTQNISIVSGQNSYSIDFIEYTYNP